MKDNTKNNPAIIFPEIIGVTLAAIATPFFLFNLFEKGFITLSALGLLIWGLGIYFTFRLIRAKRYSLVWLPMLVVLGTAYLNHSNLLE